MCTREHSRVRGRGLGCYEGWVSGKHMTFGPHRAPITQLEAIILFGSAHCFRMSTNA